MPRASGGSRGTPCWPRRMPCWQSRRRASNLVRMTLARNRMFLAGSLCAALGVQSQVFSQAQPAAPQAAERPLVKEMVLRAKWSVVDSANSVLQRSDLSAADRKQIYSLLTDAVAASNDLVKKAGDAVIPEDRAEINKLEQS